ncbi:MAG: GNAT family N-acetyltransferase [Fimbriimonadaceae bacterium]|nr:MAG: GNAT family N-acetyltransferase [Fimbriimonadaceae bacterium]
MAIRSVSPSDIDLVRKLFREYEAELRVDLCFQGFEQELCSLPGKYAEPRGAILLALEGEEPAGVVALRPLGETECEMKRLYVRPAFRGHGAGRLLAEAIVGAAKSKGYGAMALDTLERLQPAIRLYESLGFRRCEPYCSNPEPDVVFMKLELRST